MKLKTTTFVSVDGVMQGIGNPDEDRRGGFERGGWTTSLAWTMSLGEAEYVCCFERAPKRGSPFRPTSACSVPTPVSSTA